MTYVGFLLFPKDFFSIRVNWNCIICRNIIQNGGGADAFRAMVIVTKGVIHLVRTHEGGEGGQANAYECVQGGRGG